MRMYDIIKKKRDGFELSASEIRYFIEEYNNGTIPDYQASALCMAIYNKGMNLSETTELTLAMRDSGKQLDFSGIDGICADKHSSGGVGDKTSLVVAPIVASLGIKVAKISGRGLGHTGGTIDKLQSIKGFKTELTNSEFIKTVNKTGLAIVSQSEELAPADKKLYALRDVTATIESMPLIASSIMSKKLAADDDCILLDVKTGSGAFMKTLEDSRALAKLMVGIGKNAGKKIMAVISDMDSPLGNAIGNSLEVIEAIKTLNGNGPEDFTELCTVLSSKILYLAGAGSLAECEEKVKTAIKNKSAYLKLAEMVEAQGGDVEYIKNPDNFPKAAHSAKFIAAKSGYITSVDTEGYGTASLILGAGRNTVEDTIDYSAGIMLFKKTGDYIKEGEPIAELFTNDISALKPAKEKLGCSTVISEKKAGKRPVILAVEE